MTRQEVEDIAELAANAAVDKMRAIVREEIEVHVTTCPVKLKIMRVLLYVLVAGGAGGGVSKLLELIRR